MFSIPTVQLRYRINTDSTEKKMVNFTHLMNLALVQIVQSQIDSQYDSC